MAGPDDIARIYGLDEVPDSGVQTLLGDELERRDELEPSIFDVQKTIDDWAEVSIDTRSWTFRFRDTNREQGHGGATKTYTGIPFSYGDFETKVTNQQLGTEVTYDDLNCGGSIDGILLQDETANRVLVEHGEPEPAPQRQLSSWQKQAASTVYDEAKAFFDSDEREEAARYCDEGCYDLDIEDVVDDIYELAGEAGDIDQLASLFSEISRKPSDSRDAASFDYGGPLKEGVVEIEAVIRAGNEDTKRQYDERTDLRKWGGGGNFRVYGRVVEEDIMDWDDDNLRDGDGYSVPGVDQVYEEPTAAFKDQAREWMQEEHGDYWRRA